MTSVTIPEIDLKEAFQKTRLSGLWRLLKGYRFIYLIATLCIGIAAMSRAGTYMLLQRFVDSLINPSEVSWGIPVVAVGFIILSAITGGLSFISGTLTARTSEGIAKRVRDYMYDHIQRLTFSYHNQTQTGELIQRATSDIDAIRRFYADQAIGVGRILSMFIVNFTAIWLINWQLALFSIIVVPFTVAMSVIFFTRVTKAYEAYQEQDAILSSRLQENLTGVRVVKAFARQAYEIEKFEIENKEKFFRGKRLLLMHSLFWPISDILTGAQMLAGFTFAAILAINNQITVGSYMAYAGLIIWIVWPIRNMGRLIVQMSTGMVSFNRVRQVVIEPREPLNEGDFIPTHSIKGHIVFDRVNFAYEDDPDTQVLENINFVCQPGQVIALLGSTGSGKTTLANLLPRFYEYTGGNISLDGIELNRIPRKFLRSQIGIVEQEPFLFSRSIRENIIYGIERDVSDQEVLAAAKAAAVHDSIIEFPDGYDTLVGEKGVTLSGGQKQRVAIARTIIKNPRLLILDDATSSVDLETEADIRLALDKLMENRTTFIIAHRIQSVMKADLIVVLDKGKIVQKGNHSELLEQDGVYRKIFDIQTKIDEALEREVASASS
ncbi:MAG: ABC transporter ATP-binding protein [Anaerolineales bacterium]